MKTHYLRILIGLLLYLTVLVSCSRKNESTDNEIYTLKVDSISLSKMFQADTSIDEIVVELDSIEL